MNAETKYNICKQCVKFNSVLRSCSECGCFMPLKVFTPLAKCPLNKWLAESNTPEPTDE